MSERQQKRVKPDFSNTITLIVGYRRKSYILHTSYAIKTSEFFQTATSQRWNDDHIHLPHIAPASFERYIEWLYTGRMFVDNDTLDDLEDQAAIARIKYSCLMRLYVLGYFLLDTAFRNAVLDATIRVEEQTHYFPGACAIASIWTETPESSPMRRLILRHWAKRVEPDDIPDDLPQEFAVELLKELLRIARAKVPTQLPSTRDRSEYHEHHDSDVCGCVEAELRSSCL